MASNTNQRERRELRFAGASNFRDLGGYAAADGRRVKWNRLYRSASLAGLTPSDQTSLAELELALVCDLRRDEERRDAPSRIDPIDGLDVAPLNIGPTRKLSELYSHLRRETTTKAEIRAAMCELYRSFVSDFQSEYSRLLHFMLERERLPLLFHCAAGKDRTGFAAAITLAALGISREQIFEDYLLTNHYWDRGGREKPGMDKEVVASIFSAREEYLDAAFSAIEGRYGTIQSYLEDHIGLNAKALGALRSACLN